MNVINVKLCVVVVLPKLYSDQHWEWFQVQKQATAGRFLRAIKMERREQSSVKQTNKQKGVEVGGWVGGGGGEKSV